jgi:hypothetical protein
MSVSLSADGNTAIVGGESDNHGIGAAWVFVLKASGVGEQPFETARKFDLEQNYPNPFNPTTKIQFTIADRQLTIVKAYDLLGRDVATLVDEVKEPGTYIVEFDGSNLVSGMYFYRLQSGEFTQTRRLVLLR